MNRTSQTAASVGSGVLIAWAWNGAVPEMPMPAEVAAVVGAVVAPVYDVLVALRDAALARIAGQAVPPAPVGQDSE